MKHLLALLIVSSSALLLWRHLLPGQLKLEASLWMRRMASVLLLVGALVLLAFIAFAFTSPRIL